jgi:hypothetical protein
VPRRAARELRLWSLRDGREGFVSRGPSAVRFLGWALGRQRIVSFRSASQARVLVLSGAEVWMEDVEVGLRREAVRRWLAGESPEVIARELGRS